jgi:hypothetical protein
MRPDDRHVRRYLHASEAVSALLAEVQRRDALLERVRTLLPESIARHCTQATIEDGCLTLIVDSPAWVDRLRFLSPQFLPALARDADAVQDCRVRVQPAVVPRAGWHAATGGLGRSGVGSNAIQAVEQAAEALGDSGLAISLRRLAATLRRAS